MKNIVFLILFFSLFVTHWSFGSKNEPGNSKKTEDLGPTETMDDLEKRLQRADRPLVVPEPVSLSVIDPDREKWSMMVADAVNVYFKEPYQEAQNKNASFYALQCSADTVVYRPNHSLAHGLRQAFLAVDIALAFKNAQAQGLGDASHSLLKWIQDKVNHDPNFLKKIEFANAFQRTGRQSEASRSDNKERYEAYLMADQSNFLTKVQELGLVGKIFKEEEVNVFKEAITKVFTEKDPKSPEDVYFLSKIFYVAHLLDLRRLPHFSKEQILKNISKQLFGTENPNTREKQLLDKLWARTGDYLDATGDRDMEDPQKNTWKKELFCAQAHNPELMVNALHLARSKPQEKLLESIVTHVQGMRQLKERNKLQQDAPLTNLQQELASLPYTASEAYLKILLKNKYKEIPKEASKATEREITKENITTFLSEEIDNKSVYKIVKDSNGQLKNKFERIRGVRIATPDSQFVDVLVDALMEERKNRGMYVFYHATEPEIGFLFDVYSKIRSQILMEGGEDITTLRAIDESFIKFDRDLKTTPADVTNFMKKFNGVADSDQEFRNMVLSTNFSLFGSEQQENADTYTMFFEVKDRQVVTQNIDLSKFFIYIQDQSGIPVRFSDYKPIMDKNVLTCSGKPCKNGRLIQIFISPEVVEKMAYLSVLLGAPVLKDGQTPPINVPLKLLRQAPLQFQEYLKNTKGAKVQGVQDHHLRPNTLELHDLQARLFLRPEHMFDQNSVIIKSYWRLKEPDASYASDINQLVKKNLVTWLKEGAPAQPDAMVDGTVKLKKFTDIVHKNTTGIEAPKALPVSEQESFVRALVSQQHEKAAALLEDYFDRFRFEKFMLPPDQNGKVLGPYTLAELIANDAELPLVKIAFEKGVFKGGLDAFKIFSLIEYKIDKQRYLHELGSLRSPSETFRIFLKHFINTKENILDILNSIDSTQNSESLIETGAPLIQYFQGKYLKSIINGLAALPEAERGDVVKKILSDVADLSMKDTQKDSMGLKIKDILTKISQMQSIPPNASQLIWSIIRKIDLFFRGLYYVDGLKTLGIEELKSIEADLISSEADVKRESIEKKLEDLTTKTIFQPLADIFKNELFITTIKEFLKYYSKTSWPDILREAHDIINDPNEENFEDALTYLEPTLDLVLDMQSAVPSIEDRKSIYAMARGLEKQWHKRIELIKKMMTIDPTALKTYKSEYYDKGMHAKKVLYQLQEFKIEWIRDTEGHAAYKRWISAPFTTQDVIDQAKTKPEIYEITFLESEAGRLLIQMVIDQLNKDFVPTNIYPDFSSAYDRGNPSAGYNKSLIADFVSKIVRIQRGT